MAPPAAESAAAATAPSVEASAVTGPSAPAATEALSVTAILATTPPPVEQRLPHQRFGDAIARQVRADAELVALRTRTGCSEYAVWLDVGPSDHPVTARYGAKGEEWWTPLTARHARAAFAQLRAELLAAIAAAEAAKPAEVDPRKETRRRINAALELVDQDRDAAALALGGIGGMELQPLLHRCASAELSGAVETAWAYLRGIPGRGIAQDQVQARAWLRIAVGLMLRSSTDG
jgi:hypothetical protein